MIIDVRWIDDKGFTRDEQIMVQHPERIIRHRFIVDCSIPLHIMERYDNIPMMEPIPYRELTFEYVGQEPQANGPPLWLYREISEEALAERGCRLVAARFSRGIASDEVSDEAWEQAVHDMLADVTARRRAEVK